jgi:hypothetical protein
VGATATGGAGIGGAGAGAGCVLFAKTIVSAAGLSSSSSMKIGTSACGWTGGGSRFLKTIVEGSSLS